MFVAQEQVNWATVEADRQVPHPEAAQELLAEVGYAKAPVSQ